MHDFQRALQSIIATTAVLSEYLLAFDLWIVTAPRGALALSKPITSRRDSLRRRWIAALKTTLGYAISEPLWYWLMTSISSNASWFLMMCGGMHSFVVLGSVYLIIAGAEALQREHEEQCTAGEKTPWMAQAPVPIPYRDDEADHADTHGGTAEQQRAAEAGDADAKVNKLAKCPDHKPPLKLSLAPLLATVSAAATHASLLSYARFLGGKNSQEWLDRTPIGWTVIALFCLFMFGISKTTNGLMSQACNRLLALPLAGLDQLWEMKQRLSCLALMLAVRAMLRALLGQEPFARVGIQDGDGWGLLLVGAPVGESDGPSFALDRALNKLPPWAGNVASLNIVLYALGTWGWGRWQRRRSAKHEQS